MKNQNRVRINGNASTCVLQAPSAPPIVKIKIPKALHAAAVAIAKKNGQTFDELLFTALRARTGWHNGGVLSTVKTEAPAAPSPAGNGAATEAVPQSLALEVNAALDDLQRAGAAALVLCMMNGDEIQESMKAFEPDKRCPRAWKIFCVANFTDGMTELALQMANRFGQTLAAWRNDQLALICGRKCTSETSWTLENAVDAVKHLLSVQGSILSNHYSSPDRGCGALHCGFAASDELNIAWRKSLALSNQMLDVLGGGRPAIELKQAA